MGGLTKQDDMIFIFICIVIVCAVRKIDEIWVDNIAKLVDKIRIEKGRISGEIVYWIILCIHVAKECCLVLHKINCHVSYLHLLSLCSIQSEDNLFSLKT